MVSASAAVLLVLLFLSGKAQLFAQTYEVGMAFDYISGLLKNAPVHFAGHEVGRVQDVRLTGDEDGKVLVTARIATSAVIKKDSRAFIDVMGFMGEKFIELTPGTPEAPALGPGEKLRGEDPMAFYEIVDKGTRIADTFEATTADLRELIEDLDQTVGENREELNGIFANLNEASENLKVMTKDLKYHPWKIFHKGKERSAEEIAREEEKKAKKEKKT